MVVLEVSFSLCVVFFVFFYVVELLAEILYLLMQSYFIHSGLLQGNSNVSNVLNV